MYNPQVYGDPYGNKTEYYVRMSKENTTIIRAPHSNYSDDFSVYRDAYIVDLSTNIKYKESTGILYYIREMTENIIVLYGK